jgi:hypothetical protein
LRRRSKPAADDTGGVEEEGRGVGTSNLGFPDLVTEEEEEGGGGGGGGREGGDREGESEGEIRIPLADRSGGGEGIELVGRKEER